MKKPPHHSVLSRLMAVCLTVMTTSIASATVVVDFESLKVINTENFNSVPPFLQEDGFTLQGSGLGIAGTQSLAYSGDTALTTLTGIPIIITNDSGNLFNLTSIDVSRYSSDQWPPTLLWGFNSSGRVTANLRSLAPGTAPRTFVAGIDFPPMDELSRLEIRMPFSKNQINRITLEPVPEPSTLLLGCASVAMLFRRRC